MSEESKTKSAGPSAIKRLAFPIFVVVLVMSGLGLVVQSSTTGGVYDMTIAELRADSGTYVGKDVRVNGVIQVGSFKEHPSSDGIDIEFQIGDAEGNVMTVHYHQLLPDAFEEGRQVIVQGKLLSDEAIECTRLTVKCPSKYKDENAAGEGSRPYLKGDSYGDQGAAAPMDFGAEQAPATEAKPPRAEQ